MRGNYAALNGKRHPVLTPTHSMGCCPEKSFMKVHIISHSKPVDVGLNLARLMGALSLLLGAVVLLGWYLHEPALIQVNPAFVPMQYNTALGFAVGGLALLGLAGFHFARRRRS